MAKIYLILCAVYLMVGHDGIVPSGHFVAKKIAHLQQSPHPQLLNEEVANRLIGIAKSQLGVREATGNNDGPAVEGYLSYTGNKKGEAWCASFISWVFAQAGFKQPRTAWSPALFPKDRRVAEADVATVFGIYFADRARIAHVGLVDRRMGHWLYTIEGNTNSLGSREGDGVYAKLRHAKTLKYYANWIKTERKKP